MTHNLPSLGVRGADRRLSPRGNQDTSGMSPGGSPVPTGPQPTASTAAPTGDAHKVAFVPRNSLQGRHSPTWPNCLGQRLWGSGGWYREPLWQAPGLLRTQEEGVLFPAGPSATRGTHRMGEGGRTPPNDISPFQKVGPRGPPGPPGPPGKPGKDGIDVSWWSGKGGGSCRALFLAPTSLSSQT